MPLAQGAAIEDSTLQATLRTTLIGEDHTEAAAPTGTIVGSGCIDDGGIELGLGGLVLTFRETTWILFVSGITECVCLTLPGGDTRLASGCTPAA